MKQAILLLVVFAATAAIAAPFLLQKRPHDTDDIDGGVRHNDSYDAPKKIESTKITEFHCAFSTLPLIDAGELGRANYKLSAVLSNGRVSVAYECSTREEVKESRSFEAEILFMEQLQTIVAKHDFARHNGLSYFVSGLPDMYGAVLEIRYESDESIYASNNQDNFLTYDEMLELKQLFSQKD